MIVYFFTIVSSLGNGKSGIFAAILGDIKSIYIIHLCNILYLYTQLFYEREKVMSWKLYTEKPHTKIGTSQPGLEYVIYNCHWPLQSF
jgi:hypothetical protein